MGIKDVKITKKLYFGFGLILFLQTACVIIAIIGIMGIIGDAEAITESNKLKTTAIEKKADHLAWAENLSLFIHDDSIHTLNLQTDPTKCAFGKWYYSDERSHAEEILPQLVPVLAGIEKHHDSLHNSAIEIEEHYSDVDTEVNDILHKIMIDHISYASKLRDIILQKNASIANSMQTDASLCRLGAWLKDPETVKYMAEHPQFASYISSFESEHEELHKITTAITRLVSSGKIDEANNLFVSDAAPALNTILKGLNQAIELQENQEAGLNTAKNIFKTVTTPALSEVQKSLNSIVDLAAKHILTDAEMIQRAQNIRMILIVISLISLIFGVIMAIVLTRNITVPILKSIALAKEVANGNMIVQREINQKDEIGQLATALYGMTDSLADITRTIVSASSSIRQGSGQLSTSSQELSQATNEEAAVAEEVSASMEEMNSNIMQNSSNADETYRIAKMSKDKATESGQAMQETVEAMGIINEKVLLIDEIARQTNLLALNAAIEAARAGDAGKGFAVVASEVRKLADHSGTAAKEIIEQTKSGLTLARNAHHTLEALLPEIQKTAQLVEEITHSSKEQTQGASQISQALNQLDQSVQNNAAVSEELASMAEELYSQAESINQTMQFFTLDDESYINETAIQLEAPAEQTEPLGLPDKSREKLDV